jgi:Ras-related protein Rab-1A
MNTQEYIAKIIIVGEPGVGKSALLSVYFDNNYPSSYNTTIGVDFRTSIISLDEKNIKLQVWDTAGQERFRSITTSYYRGVHAIIMVFDITNMLSFQRLEKWISEIEKYVQRDKCYIILAGNKVDDIHKDHVPQDKIDEFVSKYNIDYQSISVKHNYHVETVFSKIISNIDLSSIKKQEYPRLEERRKKSRCC